MLIAVQAMTGSLSAAAATPDTSIEMTVVTSTGEPVVGVMLRATDETEALVLSGVRSRGCGPGETTPTDSAGHCTFSNLTIGHLYSIWLEGSATGSGDVRAPAYYQPIVLKVIGPKVAPPMAHGGGSGSIGGPVLTSSGEYVPGVGVCATYDSRTGSSVCDIADTLGRYTLSGVCCDVKLTGFLTVTGPYVNGSVRNVPSGSPAKIVVEVGQIPILPTPTPFVPPPSSAPPPAWQLVTQGLPQVGHDLLLGLLVVILLAVLGGAVIFARRR
ncbi:MAG TPA: hypothetical protein VHK65_10820 [Candidatus Dormibacteraeota bacterium]|nr:hypothetical protein [Candidatus Dormibacteraeota bacterium]